MNVEFFREGFELLSYSGAHLLNEEEKALLENALVMLQSTNQLHKIFFWGRIAAVNGDYYVAFGYLKDALRGRRFFFSKNCVNWFLLPPANTDEHYLMSLLAPLPLSGDISEIHEVEMVINMTWLAHNESKDTHFDAHRIRVSSPHRTAPCCPPSRRCAS